MKRFWLNEVNWPELPMHEYDLITVSHKHRKHSRVMVRVAES